MSETLIGAEALLSHLHDPRWRLMDCRFTLAEPAQGRTLYARGHLPEALYAHLDDDLSGPVTAASGRHPLPDPAAFAQRLAAWAIGDDTQVVAYDQGNGLYASRLWWLLRAVGHRRVAVLDGGFAAWTARGLPLSEVPTAVPALRDVPVRPFAGWLASDEVEQALASDAILLVDARAADRFAGRNETMDPVAGHVPGAINHPLADNLDGDGRFLPADELRRRWQPQLGERSPRELVSMCGSGVTACHNLLALEIAGLPGGRLYPGSWSEWIRDPARPVAR
ncbi:sulfurtransferase [Solimonas terrae]|uniref:Sulfurtransferase n=1 Tax=Solimonas terrae TaxID=1396819 RepID=A0A6M2BQT0_9GAMM|nr:sulfurtransferase [Solimonas terrae]NGY04660.1 sulfurtransferase [Solimonas terrae]